MAERSSPGEPSSSFTSGGCLNHCRTGTSHETCKNSERSQERRVSTYSLKCRRHSLQTRQEAEAVDGVVPPDSSLDLAPRPFTFVRALIPSFGLAGRSPYRAYLREWP